MSDHAVKVLLERDGADWLASCLDPYNVVTGEGPFDAWMNLADGLSRIFAWEFLYGAKAAAAIAPLPIAQAFDNGVPTFFLGSDWARYTVTRQHDGAQMVVRIRVQDERLPGGRARSEIRAQETP